MNSSPTKSFAIERTIRWMHKNLPTKLSKPLTNHYRSLRSAVDSGWSLNINIRKIIQGESVSPRPSTDRETHKKFGQFWLVDHLRQLIDIRPRLCSFHVAISVLLFITSQHTLQKWVHFVTIEQRFADGNLIHEYFLVNLSGTHTTRKSFQ